MRSAIGTPLVNPSPLGGEERIALYTTFLTDGTIFYYLTIVPDKEAGAFQETSGASVNRSGLPTFAEEPSLTQPHARRVAWSRVTHP